LVQSKLVNCIHTLPAALEICSLCAPGYYGYAVVNYCLPPVYLVYEINEFSSVSTKALASSHLYHVPSKYSAHNFSLLWFHCLSQSHVTIYSPRLTLPAWF